MNNFIHTTWLQRAHAGSAIACLVTLAGCASLDPTADISQAAATVTERAGTDTGWDAPWNEQASQWDGITPLSADIAVRVALQNNRAMRRQVESIVASRADFVQAHLLPNPIINVALGFPTDGLGGDPLNAGVIQQLAFIWRRPAAIDAADARLQAQVLDVSDAALDLVATTRRAHATVHFAEQTVLLQQEDVALLQQATAIVQEQESVGEATRLAVNQVELDLQTARIKLADRQLDLDRAKRQLLETLGRADADATWQTDGTGPSPLVLAADLSEPFVIEQALRQRLDIAASEMVVAARGADARLHESDRFPDISAGVSYQQNFSDRPGFFPTVGITPKLFDDNSARVAGAQSRWQQAVIEADRVHQEAIGEARRAWVAFDTARTIVDEHDTDIIALAQSNLALAREAFDAGAINLAERIAAQRTLNQVQITRFARLLTVTHRGIELERAVGGSLVPATPIDDALHAARSGKESSP